MYRLISTVFVLSISLQASAAATVQVGFLPNEKSNFCGCLAWLGTKTFAKGKLIYSQTSPSKEKTRFANMKINGMSLLLKQTKYISHAEANFEEELMLDTVTVHSVWKANNEYAGFDIKFDVKSGDVTKSLSAVGSCGCDSH